MDHVEAALRGFDEIKPLVPKVNAIDDKLSAVDWEHSRGHNTDSISNSLLASTQSGNLQGHAVEQKIDAGVLVTSLTKQHSFGMEVHRMALSIEPHCDGYFSFIFNENHPLARIVAGVNSIEGTSYNAIFKEGQILDREGVVRDLKAQGISVDEEMRLHKGKTRIGSISFDENSPHLTVGLVEVKPSYFKNLLRIAVKNCKTFH